MPFRQLGVKPYDDDDAFYIVNQGDYDGDLLDQHPAINELQVASRASILRAIAKPGNVLVKVAMPGPHAEQVRGYVTLARFLAGATPEQLEGMLGFRQGALSKGCRVYTVDARQVTLDNVGPRYFTNWPAGVSPRDLERLGEKTGLAVGYHRDYPVAKDPIPQFVLFRPVAVLGSMVVQPGERLDINS